MEFKMEGIKDTIITGYLPMITLLGGGSEFYLAETSEKAGEAASEYWKELAENDPEEFACLVGKETLCKWGLEQYAGPGSTHVRSLLEWLDLWLDTPEEQWASYDGEEIDARIDDELKDALGFKSNEVVAYRHN